MSILDDTAIFAAVVQQGGFSHAAKHLELSNGLVSRRIALLEKSLGVTLIKRTTRQLHLTAEGEVFWQHAQRIQQELTAALSLIHSSTKNPKGIIRISAPLYFGRHYLTPIITKFLTAFPDIKIDLVLSNKTLDPIKEELDCVIRGAGYTQETTLLKNSSLQMRLMIKEKIGLYASPGYLFKQGEPKSVAELKKHTLINYIDHRQFSDHETWNYVYKNKTGKVQFATKFNCNDIESGLIACITDYGIGKFTELNARQAVQQQKLRPILTQYDWGNYHLYAIYPQQQALPKRTRLLLDFINAHTQNLLEESQFKK